MVGPPVKHQSAETQARVIEPHELEKVVIRALQHNFPQKQRHQVNPHRYTVINKIQTEKKSPHPPDPTPPSNNLGWNVVPRLQKLTVLDKMINNRQKLLGAMDATVIFNTFNKKRQKSLGATLGSEKKDGIHQESKETKIRGDTFSSNYFTT